MPVITAGGIVGKVLRVYPSTSLVLMINDQSSGVGVLLEKSRLQGVLHGTPDGELLVDRVMSDEQVAAGDIVLSSGGDQIFPKGLAVGTVSAVSPGKELFLKIKVKSAADLSRLEEVLVVTDKEEQAPVTELGSKVRAADILAQRLPSVPDQPKPVVPAASTANGASHPGTNVDAKPLTSGAAKPATATVPNAVAAGGSNKVAGSNGSGSMAAGQRAAGASVSVVSKPRPSTVSHSTSSTTSSSASSPASNSANSPAASASAQPAPAKQSLAKPANPQASSQPAATEDTPH
jgi:rod shape-determining protein MreC